MTSQVTDALPYQSKPATVMVWDKFVRMCHWTVATAFFVAYFTEDEFLTLHVWAGYVIAVLIVLRIVWGFIGSRHARFSDFLYGPYKVWAYLIQLAGFRAQRYLGHSPAGGAMVFVLLIGLAATVWTGLELYAIEENAGPLAAFSADTTARDDADAGEDDEEVWEELHETLANVMLALVIFHIGGVVLASLVHRENLVRAMLTGRKRAQSPES